MSKPFAVRLLSPDASEEDIQGAERAIGEAFNGNFFNAALNNDLAKVQLVIRAHILAGLKVGKVWVADAETEVEEEGEKRIVKEIAGISVWFGPGTMCFCSEDDPDLWSTTGLSATFSDLPSELQAWWKYFYEEYDSFTDSRLGEGVKRSSWHLQLLGVSPRHQKKGIAGALVNVATRKAKEDNTICVVETRTPSNATHFYPKLGFKTEGEPIRIKLMDGVSDFPFYLMTKRE